MKKNAFWLVVLLFSLISCSYDIQNQTETDTENVSSIDKSEEISDVDIPKQQEYLSLKVNQEDILVEFCDISGGFNEIDGVSGFCSVNDLLYRELISKVNELGIEFRPEYTGDVLVREYFFGISYSNAIPQSQPVLTIEFITLGENEAFCTIRLGGDEITTDETERLIRDELLSFFALNVMNNT